MVRIRIVQLFYFPSLYCNLIFLITKIKYIWFGQSFAFSFNCEIGLCLLRDKMRHSIVIVCPLFKAYWKQSRIFEAFLEAFLEIELHFESILKHFRSILKQKLHFLRHIEKENVWFSQWLELELSFKILRNVLSKKVD